MENSKVTNKRPMDSEEDPRSAMPTSAKKKPAAALNKVEGKKSHSMFTYFDEFVLCSDTFCSSFCHSNFS
jgi:hypothetical protein